jgi:hypothetical protein
MALAWITTEEMSSHDRGNAVSDDALCKQTSRITQPCSSSFLTDSNISIVVELGNVANDIHSFTPFGPRSMSSLTTLS